MTSLLVLARRRFYYLSEKQPIVKRSGTEIACCLIAAGESLYLGRLVVRLHISVKCLLD